MVPICEVDEFIEAIRIALFNPIRINTHFFNGIDLYLMKIYDERLVSPNTEDMKVKRDLLIEKEEMCKGFKRFSPECLFIEVKK
jgi:hypothetical protein